MPTAVQPPEAVHDTASRELSDAPGNVVRVQLVPSQISVYAIWLSFPTATQSLGDAQDTPCRLGSPPTVGLGGCPSVQAAGAACAAIS
ncbi:MAG TPA: hypothetical protein VGH27_32650 [Streptosporangiaceae bacterium]|jgi:hypothetical protein